jgi:N-acetylneuraminic acid mutarotase
MKKSASQSAPARRSLSISRNVVRRPVGEGGFSGPRTLIAILLCTATACSILTGASPATADKLAFLRPEMPMKANRTLTFEERVSYQRAIEDVYWRHRIWPKERPDPKRSLDEVIPPAQIEKKVEDYLRNSQALEDYWQRPITAEQLQAEMDRMAQHTKQPEVLRELFDALGNDPFVIAECLARPALAERLVTNFYAHDQRIHGELRQRAEADLRAHHNAEQMKQTSGRYSEIELIRSDSAQDKANRANEHSRKLTSRQWDETVQKLPALFGAANNGGARHQPARRGVTAAITQIETGVLSPLQQDEGRYYATAVIVKTNDRLKLATVEWRKEPFESWQARVESQMPKSLAATTSNYTLPTISDGAGGCIDDTWTATAGPPDARDSHTVVWTGSEMIVWGGGYSGGEWNTGGRYNPSTDAWTATSAANAPTARSGHTAVWSGSEMIVWGGTDNSGNYLDTGGRYNPGADSWTPASTTSAPTGRYRHAAVWTGSEMIVWGGSAGIFSLFNTGGRYNPNTDTWTATSTTNAPSARFAHTAVWTGSEMIVWGGIDFNGFFSNTGGRYNPNTDSWSITNTTNAPSARTAHTAVWTGSEMIIWGGFDGESLHFTNTGGRYDPGTNSWITTSIDIAPAPRALHSAVWTGSEMIVWGGSGDLGDLDTGGRYNPIMDSWTNTGDDNAPDGRANHTAVWTGSEMIIWGGDNFNSLYFYTGGRYNPAIDSWTATSTINAPEPRTLHRAIWTGSEMIIWGGQNFSGYLDTGGRYDPVADSWTATSTSNAPSVRYYHTAVWTGNEMIVWGGYNNSSWLDTGGRYNPATNDWTATNTIDAPAA